MCEFFLETGTNHAWLVTSLIISSFWRVILHSLQYRLRSSWDDRVSFIYVVDLAESWRLDNSNTRTSCITLLERWRSSTEFSLKKSLVGWWPGDFILQDIFSRKRKIFCVSFHWTGRKHRDTTSRRRDIHIRHIHTRPSSPNNYNLVRRCSLQTTNTETLGLAKPSLQPRMARQRARGSRAATPP
jgi:hypothetical protein